jgi:zinc protease
MKRMRILGLAVFAAFLACLFTLPAAAQPGPAPSKAVKAQKVHTVEGITEYKLANGTRYLLFPDPSASTVTVAMTVLVGSREEGYGETGMAHLLEHMLFKGSRKFPFVDKALQAHGAARANANTWTDRTMYFEEMPGTDANLKFGIEFEADRLVNAFIRREDLAKEMTVVRNEFERNENDPGTILSQRMMAVAYEWHNYGKTTMGNRSDIERVPIDKLQDFYHKYYQPDNILVVLAGKFDPAKAHEWMAQYFGAIPRPTRPLHQTYTEEPPQDGERSVHLRRVGSVSLVGIIYHTPAGADPEYAAVEVLETILLSPPAGRLYKALVETKKATKVEGGSYAWHDPGVLEIDAQVGDKSTREEVRDILLKMLEDYTKSPTTAEELDRAKRQILAARERLMTKSTRVALNLGEWESAGDWRLFFLERDRIAKVTASDVDRVAKKFLIRSNRTTGLFVPTPAEQIVRADVPETPNVEEMLKGYKGGKSVVAGTYFDPTPANIEAHVKRSTLPGGLKVALLPKKTRGEKVVATLMLHFGNEQSLRGQTDAAELLGPLMMRGTKKYTRQQIQDQLDKLGATLSASSGTGYLAFSIQAKHNTLPAVLDLLGEVLREPTFPEAEFGILQRATKQDLESGLHEPTALARNALRRKLNPYPKDNVRYVPTIPEAIERIQQVTRDQVAKLYAEQVGASVGELVIVGDFDPDATVKKVGGFVAGWKEKVPYQRIVYTAKLDIPGGRDSIETPDKKNAVYVAAEQIAMKDTDPDYAALRLGNYILGSGGFTSLLTDKVRVKEGLSYTVGSQLSVDPLDKRGSFVIYAICNPKVMNKLEKTVAGVVSTALKEGVSAKHLEDSRKGWLEAQKLARASDGTLVSELRSQLYLGRTMKFIAEQEEQVRRLTLEEVNAALRRYIQPRRLVIVEAGDFRKGK